MRILLLSAPRSGSTYLYEVLTAYCAPSTLKKDLYRRNEFFNPNVRYLNRDFQTDLIHAYNFEIDNMLKKPNVVVKEHIAYLEDIKKQSPELFDKFIGIFDYIIVLVRNNLFESTLSVVVSKMTGEWIHYSKNQSTVTVDKDFFTTYYHFQKNNNDKLINNVLGINYNEIVYYETLPKWPRATFASLALCNTDIEQLPKMRSKHPQAPKKIDVVENYNEIKQYFYEVLDK